MKDAIAFGLYYELDGDKIFSLAPKVTARIAELEFKQSHYAKAAPYYQVLAKAARIKR
ncbi:MAG: hypothetical protein QM734_13905 [Cyclobacteriaceae bacterium]